MDAATCFATELVLIHNGTSRSSLACGGKRRSISSASIDQSHRRLCTAPFSDDVIGPLTAAVRRSAAAKGQVPSEDPRVVPLDWVPAAQMSRIIVHWTAGSHRSSGLDRSHYHLLIEGDGKLVRGIPAISLNDARGCKPSYAAHTLNCNTGSIGVSLCCMAGAVESPFKAGPAPTTRVQWDALPGVLADLCRRYSIQVTPKTVLSHAEVQGTLGIAQRGKWDIARLAFDPSVVGATASGDIIRSAASRLLET